jgi:hypothetical protein
MKSQKAESQSQKEALHLDRDATLFQMLYLFLKSKHQVY